MFDFISFFSLLESSLENFNRFLSIILFDLMIGPIFLNMKEKNFLLNERPINFAIKKINKQKMLQKNI